MIKKIPNSIIFGLRLILMGPGFALLAVAFSLLFLVLATLLLISLSGVLALAAVLSGALFIAGGTLLWPIRKYARAWIAGTFSALLVTFLNKKKDPP